MKNRVNVKIAGQIYTLVSEDSEEYMKEVAENVEEEIHKMSLITGVTATAAMVLAACNIADEKMKTSEALDNLRKQMKGYLDDGVALRAEIAELRRENLYLKSKVQE